ncbi:DUF1120 domain-containing protein [Pseudomonas trivialis]|uniref:DUF1120 domain-containing protein n=1 Tax=Pseudomonas trivialis TaxID=200450 RepID=UPI0030CDDF1F
MKQSLTMLAAAFLLAAVSPAHASSSVDLSVKGLITPSACIPLLSDGGVVDHGKIAAKDLNKYSNTQLPDATLRLTINCEAVTLIALKSTDNRHGTSIVHSPNYSEPSAFGLGLASGNRKIGGYMLKMLSSTAEGTPRGVIESVDGKTWFDAPDGTVWQPGWMRTLSAATGSAAMPLPMKVFSSDLNISTWIFHANYLPIAEEIPLDGNATLDVVYL